MPRVPAAHLAARRRQILAGARRAFLRDGFQAASMQDVLRESGLSAGAVYRYFTGKEEIVAAVAREALAVVRASFDQLGADRIPPTPDDLFVEVFGRLKEAMGAGEDARELPRLLVQIWSEALRNAELAEAVNEAYAQLTVEWARLVEEYQARGWVDHQANTVHVARTLIGAVQGYLVQQALWGGIAPEEFARGQRALVSMTVPPGEGPGAAG